MKNLFFAILLLGLAACSKENDDNTLPISATEVSNTISRGTWRITYYWDSNHEETSNFTGYNFTFGTANILTATQNTNIIPGSWTTSTDDSKTKLNLGFTLPAEFAEISDDWHVIERTETRVKLEDISGGNGGTDLLTFEKN